MEAFRAKASKSYDNSLDTLSALMFWYMDSCNIYVIFLCPFPDLLCNMSAQF